MAKCEFVDPTDNFVCGKSFQSQRLYFINPTSKNPTVHHVCGNHCTLRIGVLDLASKELKTKKDKNQVNWQEFKDLQSDIWKTCKRCNEIFKKDDVIWLIQYLKLSSDIQIAINKTFRVHQECAEAEMRLYRKKDEKDRIRKLESF